MVDTKTRRGRPIGTGIDDSDRIARLAELIRTQPDLRPTTAIRAMGFSDPSAIRRLRDKFKAAQASTISATAGSAPSALCAPRKPDAARLAGQLS
jgi:hypothetical protein